MSKRYEGNQTDNYGQELADELTIQDPDIANILDDATNLGVIEMTTEPPEGRYERSFQEGDIKFQREAQKLVDDGIITNGTLILSDTGHDLPILAELGDDLDLQGTVIVPRALASNDQTFGGETYGSGSRIQSQAQTFGEEILIPRHNVLIY